MKPFEKGDHFDGDKLLRTRLGKILAVMMPGVRIVYGKKVKEILAGCINSQYVLLIIVTIYGGGHSNQDLIWCVKIGVCMDFWVHRGS